MRVGICGDWHGDPNFANGVLHALHARGITEIIQCGDFGYGWDNQYVPSVSGVLKKFGQTLRWVPGNHENYDMIDQLMQHDAQWLTDEIYVLDRGERFTIGDTSFVGIGGAHSIDRDMRVQGVSWWPQETLTYRDVHRIIEAVEPCDVVVAHDAPVTAELGGGFFKDDPISLSNRRLLQHAVDHLQPQFLFHGHYHRRLTSQDHHGVVIVGLSDNYHDTKDNYVIFDCQEKEIVS